MSDEVSLSSKLQQALRLDKAVGLVWRSAPRLMLASSVLTMIQGILPPARLYLMKRVFDAVEAGLQGAGAEPALRQALWFIAASAALALFSALVSSVSEIVTQAQGLVVTDSVADVVHEQSIALDLAYYEDSRYYDTLHRAQQEAPYRPTRILNSLLQLGQNSVALVGVAALLLQVSWTVGLVLLGAALPGAIVRLFYSRRLYQLERKQTEEERRSAYYHWMMTNLSHAKELRLFGLGNVFRDRFRMVRVKLRENRLRLARRRAVGDWVAQSLGTLATYGTFALIAAEALRGKLTLGDVVIYYQGFQSSLGHLRAILQGLASLYEDNLFLTNFYQFLALKPQISLPAHAQPVPHPMQQGISVRGLHFTYPNTSREILTDIHLNVGPDEVVALVGANGSGKTTLIKLICRLYDPTDGSICADGIDLRELDPGAWRREISVVFQDYVEYYMTARENIWLGNAELDVHSEQIEAAARRSGADAVIQRLPQGYDTMLGHQFQKGQQISIGEWQKLALARAFLRDARVVVLDEPTSFLDPLAEADLFTQFRELIHGRSGILISHRFSTVRMADRIYVLDGGRITECGAHEELMSLDGTYAHLFRTQAKSYGQL